MDNLMGTAQHQNKCCAWDKSVTSWLDLIEFIITMNLYYLLVLTSSAPLKR